MTEAGDISGLVALLSELSRCWVLGQISSLQATQMTQEAAIRDLDNERSRLKDKVGRMEEERESLLTQCQALEDRQKQQVHSLEKVCVCVYVWVLDDLLTVCLMTFRLTAASSRVKRWNFHSRVFTTEVRFSTPP